jgi:hypothetical protein
MNKQIISGNVFIIPNMLFKPSSESDFHADQFNKSAMKHEIEQVIGRKITADEVLVEVWAFTPGENNSNWSCHTWPGKEICRFPRYLPLKDLENLKEGETITLESENFKISLTADQLGTRYRDFGKFEDVLKDRIDVFNTWESGGTIYIGGIPCNKND